MPRKKRKIWDRRRYPRRKKYYYKHAKQRNFDDPVYKMWRKAVYKRDGYRCQMPGCPCCGKKGRIFAHHIMTWADYPRLRYDVNNGITLCKLAHDKVTGNEEDYVRMFMEVLKNRIKHK